MNERPLKTVEWLAEHLHDPNLRIIDGSWHMPSSGRMGRAEYQQEHIPGAVHLCIDECAENDGLAHSFPTADRFAETVGKMGIAAENTILVYDSVGLFSAARVWWMFRYFGAQRVYVLDGGLPAWLAAGGVTESGSAVPEPASFTAVNTPMDIVDAAFVRKACAQSSHLILDARSRLRFTGEEKEVRPGLRSGHIPDSRSLPYTELLNDGKLKPDDELHQLLTSRGVTAERPIITTCGSGVTAAVIILALECIGISNVTLYDGSWSEWGGLPDSLVAVGETG